MATEGGIVGSIMVSWALFLASSVGCQDKCGDVSIPYPFGTTPSCYLNDNFSITCNQAFSPPLPQFQDTNLFLTNITLEGEL
ncbi:hypothetical protein V6N13_110099 [Hibiscus sabdariffa]|uniref:Wall-associated receptor kinase galacturonan-binding domain-containing protein n=1 Tax=Hibiscus sabdariffa TaxID=183260 RepID=A0ABR2BVP6_9ROSI